MIPIAFAAFAPFAFAFATARNAFLFPIFSENQLSYYRFVILNIYFFHTL